MGEGFPSGPWPPWHGRGEGPSEIGFVSLFLRSGLLPFYRFVYIWRSVTPIGLKPSPCFFYQKLAFLRPKKGINRLTGGPRGSGASPGGQARPPASWPPRAPSRVDSSSHILQIFQKYSPSVNIPFGQFDMGFLRNIKHATKRNWHWALDQYVSPKNNIKVAKSI